MKVYVTGVKGQLGYDVCRLLSQQGIENLGVDLCDVDITDEKAIKESIRNYHPDAVVHCAAYTAVDKAEQNAETAYRINVEGTRYIAEACREIDAKMMYFSTDYVFDGKGEKPWNEEDKPNPISVYGKTKWEGEEAVRKNLSRYYILRISWVFGRNGHNFIETMLKLAETHKELTVVDDQFGSPTFTEDLAPVICAMIKTEQYGTYHCTNDGICSWYEFAKAIFAKSGLDVHVIPVTTAEYKASAARPLNSRMDKTKLIKAGFGPLPTWEDALDRYLSGRNR